MQLQCHFEVQPTPTLLWIGGIYRGQAKEFDARNGGRAERSVLTIKMVEIYVESVVEDVADEVVMRTGRTGLSFSIIVD